jgi:hypothetical protein
MRCGCALILLSLALALLSGQASSGETVVEKLRESRPTTVHARYSLRYDGIEVGKLDITSKATDSTYSLSGSAKVSALFGTFKWLGSSNASGAIVRGAPVPAAFAFNWSMNKKSGATKIGFKEHTASEIVITPTPHIKADVVPLTVIDKIDALDPLSAVLAFTKADSRPPCDRRVGIFDGKQRYDIVLTPKRETHLPAPSKRGTSETAFVCRIMYEPIAGHRDNEDTKSYAANRDAELTLRRIPSAGIFIPYSLTIPTAWGTGSMVTERIDIVTATAGKIALTD